MNEWTPKIKKAALGVLVIALLWRVFIGSGSTLLILAAITLMASHAFDRWSARRATVSNLSRQEWQEYIRLSEVKLQGLQGKPGWESDVVSWIMAKTTEYELCRAKLILSKFDKYAPGYAHSNPFDDIELPKNSGKNLEDWLREGDQLMLSQLDSFKKLNQELEAGNHLAAYKYEETDTYEAQYAVIRQNIDALFAPTIQKINASR